MGPILTALVNLQAIENELRKARKKLKKGQQQIAIQQQRITQLEAAHLAKKEEIKLTRLQADRLELELRTKDEEINKLRVVLNGAKSNKEYSAVLTQLNVDKADKSKLEDQILSLISQVEADQVACQTIVQETEQEKLRLEGVLQTVEQKQGVLHSEVQQLDQRYAQAASEVPEKELALFKRLAGRFVGEALAEVSELNARRSEYGCGGCFMSIPLQLVNSLMSKDVPVICPNCGRLLVLELTPSTEQSTT